MAADPSLAPQAYLETLRFDMPTQFLGRTLLRDVEIGGAWNRPTAKWPSTPSGRVLLGAEAPALQAGVEFAPPVRRAVEGAAARHGELRAACAQVRGFAAGAEIGARACAEALEAS